MRLRKILFIKHVLLSFSSTLSPKSYLENACCNRIKNTVTKRLGIFKSVSCLVRIRLRKNFFPNMFFYHFLQLCPRGHISKMLAVTVIKNTVTKRLWNFQIVSCLIRMRLRKIYLSNMFLLSFSSTLSPRSYLENACCNRYQKHGY